jgi:hypothetical protein
MVVLEWLVIHQILHGFRTAAINLDLIEVVVGELIMLEVNLDHHLLDMVLM